MTVSSSEPTRSKPARLQSLLHSLTVDQWQTAALGLVIILQSSMIFTRAINWDEFFYFAEVQRFSTGQLDRGLQTIHVRLFEWLTWIPATAVDQIIAGRAAMFGFELITLASIFFIARRFVSRQIAVCSVLAYLSAGFVMQHGFSFRTDPMATGLLMSALAILARSRMNAISIGAFALLTGLSIMVTIKVALYLPAFAGLAFLRWHESDRQWDMAFRIALAGLLGLAIFAIVFQLHSAQIPVTRAHDPAAIVATSGKKMFLIGMPPYLLFAVKAALFALPLSVAIFLLPMHLFRSSRAMAERIALAGLAAPLLSLFFFHNTAPYFYSFMLAPISVGVSVALGTLAKRYGAVPLTIALALNGTMVWALDGESRIDKQRQILQMADQMFPETVRYFDHCYMLPSFKQMNGFMTPWGNEGYRLAGAPIFADRMREHAVPLIVENAPMFTQLLRTQGPVPELLPEDQQAMRGSYLHFWGPLWLAGQQLAAGETRNIDIRVPGLYSVNGGSITISGVSYDDGDVVELGRGGTVVSAGSQEVTLWWGKNRRPPAAQPPEGEFWTQF